MSRAARRWRGWIAVWIFALLLPGVCAAAGERINHEGRILGPAPVVTALILFNTPQADVVVSAMQIMPVDSAWNEDVSRRPLLANSTAMIARIQSDLGASRGTLRAFYEMNYVLVPDDQPNVPVTFLNYPDESDPAPYPFPGNMPVETWPRGTGALTLSQWQQNVNGDDGDRHAIVVKPGEGSIWETWLTRLTAAGWQASNGAKFDLKTNTLRPAGWTSGDAAGLPMFPALVRYDECERGTVEHAVRLVVKRSRVGPIYPATHQASVGNTTDPNIPAMGQRIRLKAGFVVPDGWTREEKAVLRALKKYGGIVADNGGFFSFSVCPDDRFADAAFDHLSTVGIDNFEVVQSTGATEGPRSAGAPQANAGADMTAVTNAPTTLHGAVSAPAGAALTVAWKSYSGPGAVTFIDASRAETTAVFDQPGEYTLMLNAADGVHAVAYDAVVVAVRDAGGGTQPPVATLSATVPTVVVGSGGHGEFTLTLSTAAALDCRVAYTIKGNAVPGVDYTALKGSARIKAGRTSKTIKVRPLGDLRGADKKAVKLTLAPAEGYVIGTSAPAKVKILAGQ